MSPRFRPTCAALIALLTVLPASAVLPLYEDFRIQARSNFNQTIGAFNLPTGAFFSNITVQLNDLGDVAFDLDVLPTSTARGPSSPMISANAPRKGSGE